MQTALWASLVAMWSSRKLRLGTVMQARGGGGAVGGGGVALMVQGLGRGILRDGGSAASD